MKFSIIVFSAALIAGAAAQSTTVTTTVATTSVSVSVPPLPTETNSSYGPEVDKCMTECKQGDVGCLATCLGNPNPTEEQVNETTKCAAACPQGNGSQSETEAYAKCQWDCTLKYYLPNPSNVPTVNPTKTDSTDAPVGTDDEGNPTTTNGNGNNTSSTTTGGTTEPSGDGNDDSAASTTVYSASFASIIAAFAVFLAL